MEQRAARSVVVDTPYPTFRRPTLARNVVSTSQPLAAQAGLRMLLAGGNAVDAAVATAIALTIVEPTSNGIGSDAFAIVWDRHNLHGLNASGRSPAKWSLEFFQKLGEIPKRGWHSVTIPGAVSAWVELSKRFGKLPFAKLFEPAIEYAANGFPLSPVIAEHWRSAVAGRTYAPFPEWHRVFAPNGRAPNSGQMVRLPDHARTLERIAQTNGEDFYRGKLAQQIADHSKQSGGLLALDDLAS